MPATAGRRKAALCGNVAAYLFRPPTGLADGLALKELALLPRSERFAPTTGSPVPAPASYITAGNRIRRGRQASKPALSILPSTSDAKTFSPPISGTPCPCRREFRPPHTLHDHEFRPRSRRLRSSEPPRTGGSRPRRDPAGDQLRRGRGPLRPARSRPVSTRHSDRRRRDDDDR